MAELLRLARRLRCHSASPGRLFAHRLGVGLIGAALILLLSFLR